MRTDYDYQFFLSFDGEEKNIRTKLSLLKERLDKNHVKVFYDKDHDAEFLGKKYIEITNDAIRNSQFFLSFFQPNIEKRDNKSETNREQELEFAIKVADVYKIKGFIHPVIIGETSKDKILAYLKSQNKFFVKDEKIEIGYKSYKDFNEEDIEELCKILVKKVKSERQRQRQVQGQRVFSTKFQDIKKSKGQNNIPLSIEEIQNFPPISLQELKTYIYSVHKHDEIFTDFDIQLKLEAI